MSARRPRPSALARGALIGTGTLIMGYAVGGVLTDPRGRPVGQLLFMAAVLVAHDGVLMPLVLGGGALIGRLLPVPARPAVRVAAFTSLAVAVVAAPLVLGYGRRPDDPSALPLDYGRGLLAILLLVWSVALARAWLATRSARGRKDVERPSLGRRGGIRR